MVEEVVVEEEEEAPGNTETIHGHLMKRSSRKLHQMPPSRSKAISGDSLFTRSTTGLPDARLGMESDDIEFALVPALCPLPDVDVPSDEVAAMLVPLRHQLLEEVTCHCWSFAACH